jgi:holo-[acyl-carrier protein] synthase
MVCVNGRYHIGTDIIEIGRFRQESMTMRSRLEKIFTPKEIDYCSKDEKKTAEHYAARFAGKEAIIKAFTPWGVQLGFRDIEITLHQAGYPVAVITHENADLYDISISLSHSENHAIAVALVALRTLP